MSDPRPPREMLSCEAKLCLQNQKSANRAPHVGIRPGLVGHAAKAQELYHLDPLGREWEWEWEIEVGGPPPTHPSTPDGAELLSGTSQCRSHLLREGGGAERGPPTPAHSPPVAQMCCGRASAVGFALRAIGCSPLLPSKRPRCPGCTSVTALRSAERTAFVPGELLLGTNRGPFAANNFFDAPVPRPRGGGWGNGLALPGPLRVPDTPGGHQDSPSCLPPPLPSGGIPLTSTR